MRTHRDRIVEAWVRRVRAHLAAARSQAAPELIDDIPELLARLAHALESSDPLRELERAATAAAARHGEQRALQTSYSLEEVIVEHQLLDEAVLEVLEIEGPIDAASRELLHRATLLAIRSAAAAFARSRNVTAAAQLRDSDTRFRHMVEAVTDYAIFTVDPEGFITSWNVGCVRVKGYTVEEAIGRHYSMLYPEEGRRRDEPMAHLRTAAIEGRFRGEGMRERKGGEQFLADVSITPIYEAGTVIGFTKVVQDLTERNLIVQERDLSRTDGVQLREEAEYRERLVAALSHDLRSPLAVSVTAAELIAKSPGDPAKVTAWSQKIVASLLRADRMIADLLDTSRLHAGESLSLDFAHCDARVISQDLIAELADRHGDRFRIDAEGDTAGFWSPDGLHRIVENLLVNAVKYGEDGQPITVRLRRVDDHLLLAVHNFGTLIPVEEQRNLFRAFHRAPTARRSGKPGWGIGLTLVKGIVEAHGGVVKAESYPIEGTTFTVDLPVDGAAASRVS